MLAQRQVQKPTFESAYSKMRILNSSVFNLEPALLPLLQPLPEPGQCARYRLEAGRGDALAIAKILQSNTRPCLVVTEEIQDAQRLVQEIKCLGSDLELYELPDRELLPYDFFSPHPRIAAARAHTLSRLATSRARQVIAPMNSLMLKVPPPVALGWVAQWKVGMELDRELFVQQLIASGYQRVDSVYEPGEFALRGSLVDVHLDTLALRIELDDDRVDSIRTFDCETQRSVGSLETITAHSGREYPFAPTDREQFMRRFRMRFEYRNHPVFTEVQQGIHPAGIENYLPLFYEQMSSLFDYLPSDTLVVEVISTGTRAVDYWEEIQARYQEYSSDGERALLSPDELFITPKQLREQFKNLARIQLTAKSGARKIKDIGSLPANLAEQQFECLAARDDAPTLLVAESPGRREVLLRLLHENKLQAEQVDSWQGWLEHPPALGIWVAPLQRGFTLKNRWLVTEYDLFQRLPNVQRRSAASKTLNAIETLAELKPGALVVHRDNGIGRYLGLESLSVQGIPGEFAVLEYAGGDKLFLPIDSLHLLSRYSGEDTPLHQLGGKRWNSNRKKASKKARDIATELLDIYSRRLTRVAPKMNTPAGYEEFAESFPYTTTPDQQAAIDAILTDLASGNPMDRLVCGDVGFGKTEVALRAAFTAMENGYQVALLAPTTLLVNQHYDTCSTRLAALPYNIAEVSSFVSARQRKQSLEQLANGQVDMIIGTHALLSSAVSFKQLGLLIVDEEHRFGVSQKERLKKTRESVHCLALTATPIPRTLNMAMNELRDISIIATAPENRMSIRTTVCNDESSRICEAIQRELQRGGQVYYVHNQVRSIEAAAERIHELVPQARIAIAHGQMGRRELELAMRQFYRRECNVLVCSSIIETGLDIPNANTIIVENAAHFGLAQLHQLRGRVGRSHHQAHAYLLLPYDGTLNRDAQKRLRAIEDAAELGSGFLIASADLDIRGAGELLGGSQSGHIQDMGLTLFSEMIQEAVAELRGEKPLGIAATEIDMHEPAFIPGASVPDPGVRLKFYRRIAACNQPEQLQDIIAEMADCFGTPDTALRNLFAQTELRIGAASLGIARWDMGTESSKIIFHQHTPLQPGKLLQLVMDNSASYSLENDQLTHYRKTTSVQDKQGSAQALIVQLQGCC